MKTQDPLPYREFRFEHSLRKYDSHSASRPASRVPNRYFLIHASIMANKHRSRRMAYSPFNTAPPQLQQPSLPIEPVSLNFDASVQQIEAKPPEPESIELGQLNARQHADSEQSLAQDGLDKQLQIFEAEIDDLKSVTSVGQASQSCMMVDLEQYFPSKPFTADVGGTWCSTEVDFKSELRRVIQKENCGCLLVKYGRTAIRISLRRLRKGKLRVSQRWPEPLRQQILQFCNL